MVKLGDRRVAETQDANREWDNRPATHAVREALDARAVIEELA